MFLFLLRLFSSVDLSDETDTTDYFERCIYGLGFLFRECEKCFEEMTLNELVCQYSSLIQWTGQEKVYELLYPF